MDKLHHDGLFRLDGARSRALRREGADPFLEAIETQLQNWGRVLVPELRKEDAEFLGHLRLVHALAAEGFVNRESPAEAALFLLVTR